MDFHTDFVTNSPVRTGIYCRYSELSEDIEQNKAIKWALETRESLATASIRPKLRDTFAAMAGVDTIPNCPEFAMPGRSDLYFSSLWLVKILQGFESVGTGAYGRRGQGYLVDMNKVFEGYVREQLRTRLRLSGIEIAVKRRADKLLCDRVKIVPDLVLLDTRSRAPLAVADCKYKRDWKYQSADTYQMLAYLEGFRPVSQAIVFFPSAGENIVIEHANLPRKPRLIRVVIPWRRLLDGVLWDSIALRVLESGLRPTASAA